MSHEPPSGLTASASTILYWERRFLNGFGKLRHTNTLHRYNKPRSRQMPKGRPPDFPSHSPLDHPPKSIILPAPTLRRKLHSAPRLTTWFPTTMKENIHPKTTETTITCTCGAVYNTISTVPNLRIGICSACHPYFTGEQRFIDTAGRVDKFAQRYGSVRARRTAPKLEAAAPAAAEAPAEA